MSETPPGLQNVRAFVNTKDTEAGTDELGSPQDLQRWLTEHDLPNCRITARDMERAIDVREGLRAVLLGHAGHDVDAAAVERLNAALATVPLHAVFGADGDYRMAPAEAGLDAALGQLLGQVAAAVADGSWARLKACAKDSCQWAFYDESRNRSGRWCSMAVCGNRVKMQRAYSKRRAED